MSVFILSNKHINVLVSALLLKNRGIFNIYDSKDEAYEFISYKDGDKIGQILLNENYRSINYRYNDTQKPPHKFKYQFQSEVKYYDYLVQIFAACDCYDYQSCETDDYKQTLAYSIIDKIRKETIRRLRHYDKAEWSIE
jgi:hypothetical protein